MLKLDEYIKNNRVDSAVKLTDSWYGEMLKGTRPTFYDVPVNGGEKRVFCFISYPTTTKPKDGYPAVLLIHGGNGEAFYEMSRLWADRGFVTICPDFNGKYAKTVNERQVVNIDGGNEGYGSVLDLKEEHTWAYFSVLSAMRAIDVLFSLEDVDKNNVFSCGLSWGGVIQLLLSSVDHRLKASSVIYSSAYLLNSDWGKGVVSSLSDDDKVLWDNFIDPKNYLDKINTPLFFTAGADDIAFKMESRRLTAKDIISPVYFGLKKNFPHGNFYGFEQVETLNYFNEMIKGNKIPKPIVDIEGDKLSIKPFDKKSKLELCYTKDNVEISDKQNWEILDVLNKRQTIIPRDVTALFVIEKQKNDYYWSSDMIKIK